MSHARVLLKSTETKRYLGRGGTWTDQPEAAMAFLDEIRAKDHIIYHRLLNTQVVVLAEAGAAKAPVPAPVIVTKKPTREEATTKTRKSKSRTPKSALTKLTRPQSMENRAVPHQMSEVTENQPASGSTSTGSQFAKTAAFTELMTIIEAKMDVGFGNALFIRGQGAGLSWDKGQPMNCADGTTWMWSGLSALTLWWSPGKGLRSSPSSKQGKPKGVSAKAGADSVMAQELGIRHNQGLHARPAAKFVKVATHGNIKKTGFRLSITGWVAFFTGLC
jgi:PTS HPr component phosphorylation site